MCEDARKAQRHDLFFVGGADAFFYKGSNGRWRDVLTGEQLVRYERRIAEVLTPEEATWLEHGRLGAPTA
jgi:aryl sulfotransferase